MLGTFITKVKRNMINMKNLFRISGVILLILSISLTHSCKKDKPTPPIITTTAASAITQTTATAGGNVTSDGGATVTAHGVCWSTTTGPTTASGTKTTDGTGTGIFTSSITALTAGTVYYLRAYATNSAGTAYGNEISFTSTASTVPVLTTTATSAITQTTATSGGNITSDGGAAVTARGVCWSTTTGPTTALSTKTTDNTGTGIFTTSITALTAGTVYYVRAYATNSAGTAYGDEITFTTIATGPVLTTTAASLITQTTTTSGGNVTSDGGASVTVRGVCWSTLSNPTIANSYTSDAAGTGTFISSITGLTAGTIYYLRAYATNSVGTVYGNQINFTTLSIPTVSTTSVTTFTSTSATVGGNVTADGGVTVTERGVYWGISQNPESTGTKLQIGSGTGSFSTSLTGLYPNTTYYVRAYATNSIGTGFGNEISFITSKSLPTLTLTGITSITNNSASTGGNISSDGGSAVTARGVCWSTSPSPTILNSKTTDGTGTGTFTSLITGLTLGTTYYLKAYATNSVGTSYSPQEVIFTISPPSVTTSPVTGITPTTATSGGNVTIGGGAIVTAHGVCWSTNQNPTIVDNNSADGTGIGVFTSSITGLTQGTTYYVRAYAINSIGTSYGIQVSFTTLGLPAVVTATVTDITPTTATSGGNVTADGGITVTARGVCWSTSQNPTTSDSKTSDASGTGTFTSSLTELIGNTIYYLRAYATNNVGTSYGNELSFKTYTGSVTDIDGNIYNTVTIGTQIWIAENLKTTKYPDGTNIPIVNTVSAWNDLTITDAAYCWYDDDIVNKNTYGAFYTWSAAMNGTVSSSTNPSGVQGVCPTGWHLPSDGEWKTLEMYLGMTQGQADLLGDRGTDQGSQLKEAGTIHWDSPNTGTNSSGFTALPGGGRKYLDGLFYPSGRFGFWWSTSEDSNYQVWYRMLYNGYNTVSRSNINKATGYSVRCVKDN